MHFTTLFLIGAILLLAIFVAKGVDKLSYPHVVGFLLLGVFLGDSVFGVLPMEKVKELGFITNLALGFIGFGMGEHMHLKEIKKLGKSIVVIALLESLGAFLAVFVGVYFVTKSAPLALIFASLASATAPAATVDVIKQYKAKGPLSTTLLAVIGIDDAFALLLYSVSVPFAIYSLSGGNTFSMSLLTQPVIEIILSVGCGILVAYPVDYVLDRMRDKEEMLLFLIASVIVVIGIAESFHLSVILTTLVFGMATVNLKHTHAKYISNTIDRVGPIIYILFFTLVGARLDTSYLGEIGLIGIAYLIFRAGGKIAGAYIGASVSKATTAVKKYMGFALLSQAGVAVGLALSFGDKTMALNGEVAAQLERTIISTIVATTLIVQIVGPLLAKHAIFKAGEATDPEGSFFG